MPHCKGKGSRRGLESKKEDSPFLSLASPPRHVFFVGLLFYLTAPRRTLSFTRRSTGFFLVFASATRAGGQTKKKKARGPPSSSAGGGRKEDEPRLALVTNRGRLFHAAGEKRGAFSCSSVHGRDPRHGGCRLAKEDMELSASVYYTSSSSWTTMVF